MTGRGGRRTGQRGEGGPNAHPASQMIETNLPQPPSGAVLPSLGTMPRAGSPLQQRTYLDAGWLMLETFRYRSGLLGSRMSNEWLGERGWCVQLIGHWDLAVLDANSRTPLTGALREMGADSLLGGVFEPPADQPAAIWRMQIKADCLGRFFEAHHGRTAMAFDEGRSFAIHSDAQRYAVCCGPEAFVRAALPERWIGQDATDHLVEGVELEFGKGCMNGILEHYSPFMLD
jgi:hypothetical protein